MSIVPYTYKGSIQQVDLEPVSPGGLGTPGDHLAQESVSISSTEAIRDHDNGYGVLTDFDALSESEKQIFYHPVRAACSYWMSWMSICGGHSSRFSKFELDFRRKMLGSNSALWWLLYLAVLQAAFQAYAFCECISGIRIRMRTGVCVRMCQAYVRVCTRVPGYVCQHVCRHVLVCVRRHVRGHTHNPGINRFNTTPGLRIAT